MDDIPDKEFSWKPILIGAAVIVVTILVFLIAQDKKRQREREAVLHSLDQELAADEQAVKEERKKLEAMTHDVEDLRAQIQSGSVKNGKAAVEEFNKKAAEQRAERERFVQMADQYNQKVARYRDLQQ